MHLTFYFPNLMDSRSEINDNHLTGDLCNGEIQWRSNFFLSAMKTVGSQLFDCKLIFTLSFSIIEERTYAR